MEITQKSRINDIVKVSKSSNPMFPEGSKFFVRNRMYDRTNNNLLYTVMKSMNHDGSAYGETVKLVNDGTVKLEIIGNYELNSTMINSYEKVSCTR